MKQNMLTLLGIAFVVAIIATGLFYGLVVTRLDQSAEAGQPMIVVAARDLDAGDQLTAADFESAPKVGDRALVEGFTAPSELDGLTLLVSVRAGEPVARAMVAARDSAGGAAVGVRPGLRAVSVHVADSAGVIDLLKPGRRVDAQVVEGRGRAGGTISLRTVLQNLEVLSVEPPVEGRNPGRPVVTLLALPEEADVLGVADAAAEIRLVLRHPLDNEITDRERVTVSGAMTNPPEQTPREEPLSRRPAAGSVDDGPVEAAQAAPAR